MSILSTVPPILLSFKDCLNILAILFACLPLCAGENSSYEMKKSANEKNYYKILGVERDASHENIRDSFKSLSLECHPDKSKKNIEEAKECLLNPIKRMLHNFSLYEFDYELIGITKGDKDTLAEKDREIIENFEKTLNEYIRDPSLEDRERHAICDRQVALLILKNQGITAYEKYCRDEYTNRNSSKKDYYKILNVKLDAAKGDIEASVAKALPEIEKKIREINEANECLSDPLKRAVHDIDISKSNYELACVSKEATVEEVNEKIKNYKIKLRTILDEHSASRGNVIAEDRDKGSIQYIEDKLEELTLFDTEDGKELYDYLETNKILTFVRASNDSNGIYSFFDTTKDMPFEDVKSKICEFLKLDSNASVENIKKELSEFYHTVSKEAVVKVKKFTEKNGELPKALFSGESFKEDDFRVFLDKAAAYLLDPYNKCLFDWNLENKAHFIGNPQLQKSMGYYYTLGLTPQSSVADILKKISELQNEMAEIEKKYSDYKDKVANWHDMKTLLGNLTIKFNDPLKRAKYDFKLFFDASNPQQRLRLINNLAQASFAESFGGGIGQVAAELTSIGLDKALEAWSNLSNANLSLDELKAVIMKLIQLSATRAVLRAHIENSNNNITPFLSIKFLEHITQEQAVKIVLEANRIKINDVIIKSTHDLFNKSKQNSVERALLQARKKQAVVEVINQIDNILNPIESYT